MATTAELESLAIDGYELRELTPGGANWDDIIELRRQTHYYDCWEHVLPILPRTKYDELLAESPVQPAALGRDLLKDDEITFFAWFKESMYAFAAFKRVELAPGAIPALWVQRLYTVPDPDPGFVSGLVSSVEQYAKLRKVRVLRMDLAGHVFPVQEALEARGGRVTHKEVHLVIQE